MVMVVMLMVILIWWLIAMMGAFSKAMGREILTMGYYAPFMETLMPTHHIFHSFTS